MSYDDAHQPSLLDLQGVQAAYGRTIALRDINLQVGRGRIVGLLGANGAGKTTLLRVASGLLKPVRGSVIFGGDEMNRRSPSQRTKTGMCLIPEGRGIFRNLTVRENLELFRPGKARGSEADLAPAVNAFPILGKRMKQLAGSLSGGEQQMLAVAKAYLRMPTLILADELSLGLAPMVIDEIYESLRELNAQGVSLLIVEQYVSRIREMADDIYILSKNQVAWSGKAATLDERDLLNSYLGEDLLAG